VVHTFFAAGVNQLAVVTVHVCSILLTATKNLGCLLTDRHVTLRTKQQQNWAWTLVPWRGVKILKCLH